MPLPRLAARRANRKAEVSPLLGPEWRSRERSEWRCLVVKMGDMHCSTGSRARPAPHFNNHWRRREQTLSQH